MAKVRACEETFLNLEPGGCEFLQVQQAENKENHKFMEALLQSFPSFLFL